MLKIIDWLIISNSRAIMLQSLCGNIYKCSSSAEIKERELTQGNCRGKVWNVDGIGCCQSEIERFNISLSFTNKLWKTNSLCPSQLSDGM